MENRLVDPAGKPLVKEPRFIVIKTEHPLNPQFVETISQATGCSVVCLPMNVELLKGKIAVEQFTAMHQEVHKVMQIPFVSFKRDELENILICATERIKSNPSGSLVQLEEKLKEVLK